jgi:hypothetical protein
MMMMVMMRKRRNKKDNMLSLVAMVLVSMARSDATTACRHPQGQGAGAKRGVPSEGCCQRGAVRGVPSEGCCQRGAVRGVLSEGCRQVPSGAVRCRQVPSEGRIIAFNL